MLNSMNLCISMIILCVFIIIIWINIIYISIKIINLILKPEYRKSEYYSESSFPMRIIYKTNGFEIKNASKSINYAISHYNAVLKYHLFSLDNNNNSGYVITIQNSMYSHGCVSDFDGFSGVLAHATLPPNRLLCIDVSENWNNKRDNDMLFKRVLIHELGHILGLHHAFDMNSVMSYNNIQHLQEYDIECLKKIYPFLK